jgi:hypothetical protein
MLYAMGGKWSRLRGTQCSQLGVGESFRLPSKGLAENVTWEPGDDEM